MQPGTRAISAVEVTETPNAWNVALGPAGFLLFTAKLGPGPGLVPALLLLEN